MVSPSENNLKAMAEVAEALKSTINLNERHTSVLHGVDALVFDLIILLCDQIQTAFLEGWSDEIEKNLQIIRRISERGKTSSEKWEATTMAKLGTGVDQEDS